MDSNSRAERARLLKEINQYRGTAELTMMRKLIEIELEDAKDKLLGAPPADTQRLQGGGRVLRFLLDVLTKGPGDIEVKVERTNG